MDRPGSVNIASVQMPVRYVEADSLIHDTEDGHEHTILGFFYSEDLLIEIKDGLTPERERFVLTHEILHSILELSNLATLFEHLDEENLVSRLTPFVLSFIRENPDVVAYLQGEA